MATWTSAQSAERSRYNHEDQSEELTYDDLVEELNLKKQNLSIQNSHQQIRRREIQFGYALSKMSYRLIRQDKSFSMGGVDLRLSTEIPNQSWFWTAGIKSFATLSSSGSSLENKLVHGYFLKQDILANNLTYFFGAGPSLSFISARGLFNRSQEQALALDLAGGIRGNLSNDFSWSVDFSAVSPVIGKALKGGVITSIMVSSPL